MRLRFYLKILTTVFPVLSCCFAIDLIGMLGDTENSKNNLSQPIGQTRSSHMPMTYAVTQDTIGINTAIERRKTPETIQKNTIWLSGNNNKDNVCQRDNIAKDKKKAAGLSLSDVIVDQKSRQNYIPILLSPRNVTKLSNSGQTVYISNDVFNQLITGNPVEDSLSVNMPFRLTATIFSFDGGGIRGIISATICKFIEECLQSETTGIPISNAKTISSYANMLAGTSIGGALALVYSMKNDDYTGSFLQNMFLESGAYIFKQTWLNWFSFGILGSKYYSNGREVVFKKILGEMKLSELKKDLIVPTFNLNNREPLFFKSANARKDDAADYRLIDVAMATSAAPTYFDPYTLQSVEDKAHGKTISAVDGGLVENDPSLCALAEAMKIYPNAEEFVIVSIGTGHAKETQPITYSGTLGFAMHVSDILVRIPTSVTRYLAKNLGYSYNKPVHFFRFDVSLDEEHMDMDNTEQENLLHLVKTVEQDKELMEKIANFCTFIKSKKLATRDELVQTNGENERKNNFKIY